MARWIAGLDGGRGAWAGALLDGDDPGRFRCGLFESLASLLDGPEVPLVVGIDVPIGRPDRILGGGRTEPLPDPPGRGAEGPPAVIWSPAPASCAPAAKGPIPGSPHRARGSKPAD